MANSHSAKSFKEIIFHVQMQLKHKGQNALKVLSRNLATLPSPNDVQKEDLDNLLRASDIFLPLIDLTYLTRHFRGKVQTGAEGGMDFQPLYQLLNPELTPRRTNIIEKTWRRLDVQGHGMLPLQYIFQHYNVDNHPDVASGLRQGQDVLSRFLDAFDAAEKGETGLVTKDEFLSNYRLISASYPHDENAFVKMMECVWGLKENESGVVISIEALILQLRDKLLLRMKGAETEEQVLMRGFKFIDLNNNGVLDRKEFQHALQVLGVTASDQEISALFNEFDQEGRGIVDYSAFVYTITGRNDHIMKKSVTHSLFATATRRIID